MNSPEMIVKLFSASNLGGNPYYNYLISAAVEIPGGREKCFWEINNLFKSALI